MYKSLVFIAGLVVVIAVVIGGTASARMPFEAASDSLTMADRVPISLTAATVLPYGWPVNLGYFQTGQVEATFDDWGCFGKAFHFASSPLPSFDTPTGSNVQYLFGGALWVGGIVGGDTLVSVGADGWQQVYEFFPTGDGPGNATIQPYPYAGELTLRGEYADTSTTRVPSSYLDGPFQSMHIKVANRAHVWDQSTLNNAVIYDMVITNIGDQTIDQGYVGFYFDVDVCVDCGSGGYDDDLAGSIRDDGIGYVIDNNGDPIGGQYPENLTTPRVFAFRLLHTSLAAADTAFNWWVSNGTAALDYGPRMRGTPEDPYRDFGTGGTGTPEGNRNKYYMLSHREWDYDQVYAGVIGPADAIWMEPPASVAQDVSDGYDTKFLMSIGPFDLTPDSSVRIIFTTFTADSIHIDPNNLSNLPGNPATYESNLQLGRMPAVTDVIDTLTPYLTDPDLPPLGLTVTEESYGIAEIEWDAWPESAVDGYDVFVTPVDPATFPFPGAIPPWYELSSPQPEASTGRLSRASIGYFGGQLYAVNVAHRFGGQTGQLSRSEWVGVPEPSRPSMPEYTFYYPGQPVNLWWSDSWGADRYNIYKFARADYPYPAIPPIYEPFYSTYLLADAIHELKDSISVNGTTYYYYAMTPYAQVLPNQFLEYISDSTIYVVKAVDEYGFESEYAITTAFEVPLPIQGTLVLTNSTSQAPDFADITDIKSFYASVLSGQDYTVYDIKDSIATTPYYNSFNDCPNWLDLMPFGRIIIDDRYIDNLPYNGSVPKIALDRYQAGGGKILYFGSFRQGTGTAAPTSVPAWYPVTNSWMSHIFGIDSAYNVGYGYFVLNSLPMVDTIFGFNRAEPIGGGYPELHCDTLAYPLGTQWATYWPTNTPPMISSFHVSEGSNAIPIYSYRSLVPGQSRQEGDVVGVKITVEGWVGPVETYAFGFHLYYMDTLDARALLNAIDQPNASPSLALPQDPDYRVKGVSPQRGYTTDSYEFRVSFSDPDGDAPYPGFPRVHVLDGSWQEIEGSPFAMTELKEARLDPFTGTYSVTLSDLGPDIHSYYFEARDDRASPAASLGSYFGPIVTGPGGNVLHVAASGSDLTGDGSSGNPFATISHAAETAANGDTIVVSDGTYTGGCYTYGKALVVRSENGPAATVFDGGGIPMGWNVVGEFDMFEDSTTILDGFTFRGVVSVMPGGGAVMLENASPIIRNCRFEGNFSPFAGALGCVGGAPLIEFCTFVANSVDSVGGAVFCGQGATPLLRNCTFVRNVAPGGGAAIWAADSASLNIENCNFAYNDGLGALGCDPSVVDLTVSCTNVFGNVGGDWSGALAPFDGVAGNLSVNPKFCDPAAGDFHVTANSVCAPANNACGVLIGADPVDPFCPGCCHVRGDADNSGVINIADLTLIVSATFQGAAKPLCFEEADVDGSDSHNIADITYLVAWLFQGGPPSPSCP